MPTLRNKRYDPNLKNRYDKQGKKVSQEIMRDFLGAKFFKANINEDQGNFSDGFWDQIYEMSNGVRVIVESEMKDSKWWGEEFSANRPFKYDTMDIPFRKAKNSANLFAVISTDESFAFLVTRKAMDAHLATCGGGPKIKKTKYEPNGAPYFSTPIKLGYFVKKQNGKWVAWKPVIH